MSLAGQHHSHMPGNTTETWGLACRGHKPGVCGTSPSGGAGAHPGLGWQENKTGRALVTQRRVQVRLLEWPSTAPLREQTTFSAVRGLETGVQSRGTGTYWPTLASCRRGCSQARHQVAARHSKALGRGSPSEGRPSPSFQRPWNQLPLPSSILDKSFEHLYLFYFKPKGQKWDLLLTRTRL